MTNFPGISQSRRRFVRQTLLSAGGLLLTSVASATDQLGITDPDAGKLNRSLANFGGSIQGKVLLASDASYDGMRRALSFNPQTDKFPAIIAQCKTAQDVVRSIEFARTNSLEIAVRSGGCDVMGQSTCDGGMLIDLSLLQEIELRAEDHTVRVGAGVRCGTLDSSLSSAGVIVPLACNPMVGVSGLTLGGGLGWVLGKHGTTADNVIAMDMVTADGNELRVSEEQNEDLFWALRGGGGNFGIVTAFEYKVHPLAEVYGGFLLYPLEMLGDYLRFYQDIMANAPDELVIEISIAQTNPPMFVATVCYSGEESSMQAVLTPIRKFGPPVFDGLRPTKLSQLTAFTKEVTSFVAAHSKPNTGKPKESDGYFNHWRGATISEWTDSAINSFITCIENAPAGWSIGIGHYMHGAPCAISAEATPILRDEHSSSYFFNMSWGHSSQSNDSMEWVDQSIKDMQPFNRAGTYINYLSSNDDKAVADAYGANYPRLRKIKSQYDAENSFHLNRNIRG